MTVRPRFSLLVPLLTGLLAGCQGPVAPDLPLLRDPRGSYDVSWLVTYRNDDATLLAQASCSGSVVIDGAAEGQFSGTAIMAPGEPWPCVAAVVPLQGNVSPLDRDPIGGGRGWRLTPVLPPTAVFAGCSFVEAAPEAAKWAPFRGIGSVSPVGQIALMWFGDIYECHGARFRLEVSLTGERASST